MNNNEKVPDPYTDPEYIEILEGEVRNLKAELQKREWISVDDPPKDKALVLISYTFLGNGNTYQGCANYLNAGGGYEWFSDDGKLVFNPGEVTCWTHIIPPTV